MTERFNGLFPARDLSMPERMLDKVSGVETVFGTTSFFDLQALNRVDVYPRGLPVRLERSIVTSFDDSDDMMVTVTQQTDDGEKYVIELPEYDINPLFWAVSFSMMGDVPIRYEYRSDRIKIGIRFAMLTTAELSDESEYGNTNYLAEMYKLKGESIFWIDPYLDPTEKEHCNKIRLLYPWERKLEELEEKFGAERIKRIKGAAFYLLQEVVTFDEFMDEERNNFLDFVSLDVVSRLSDVIIGSAGFDEEEVNWSAISQADIEEFKKTYVLTMDKIWQRNQEVLVDTSNLVIKIPTDQSDEITVEVDFSGMPGDETKIEKKEDSYPFKNWTFRVLSSGSDVECEIENRTTGQKAKFNINGIYNIDIRNVVNAMTSPEQSGWEKVFDMMPKIMRS